MGKQIINLTFLLGLAVASSFWLLYYSELFPIVGGLLGLTGAFAWFAFLSNLLTGDLKSELQALFQRICLDTGWATTTYVVLTLVLFGFASTRGAVVIDALGDDTPRILQIRTSEGEVFSKKIVRPRETNRVLVTTGFLGQTFELKLSGLPQISIEVNPWQRHQLISPESFYNQPVMLFWPNPEVSGTAANGGFYAEVWVDDKLIESFAAYKGETLWVGTEDVTVPPHVVRRWRLKLVSSEDQAASIVYRWSEPLDLPKRVRLAERQKVEVRILRNSDNGTFATGTGVAKKISSQRQFPQEITIVVKK